MVRAKEYSYRVGGNIIETSVLTELVILAKVGHT